MPGCAPCLAPALLPPQGALAWTGKGEGHPLAQGVPVHVATLARTWPKRFETGGCA